MVLVVDRCCVKKRTSESKGIKKNHQQRCHSFFMTFYSCELLTALLRESQQTTGQQDEVEGAWFKCETGETGKEQWWKNTKKAAVYDKSVYILQQWLEDNYKSQPLEFTILSFSSNLHVLLGERESKETHTRWVRDIEHGREREGGHNKVLCGCVFLDEKWRSPPGWRKSLTIFFLCSPSLTLLPSIYISSSVSPMRYSLSYINSHAACSVMSLFSPGFLPIWCSG